MSATIYNSDRYFTIFDFSISHSQLLLRSSKNENQNTNIDVIFFDVKFQQLSTYLMGLEISIKNNQKTSMAKKDNFFILKSNNEEYHVVASFVKVYENHLNFGETSLGVLQNKGREVEIASST